ncbi:unnamed protein product [Leptosia nina]|uniref:Major facilitator superfamily (MFS) profile domain-containing protein n=1 Tax=Leptosia nina TaxID=320188 RepID=A0AAV1JA50_9NEOP
MDPSYNNINPWLPLLRQSFVFSGVVSFFFIHGLFVGAPTVFIPQLRKEYNSTEFINLSMESWLSSTVFYSSLPWAVIIPLFAHTYGRKKTEILLCIDAILSSVILYFSETPIHIIISQIIIGVQPPAHLTISLMVLTEFSPRYRGLFMTFKSATTYWGIWMSNAIGTYFHWKNIALVSFVCSVYTLTTLLWPESPYWLASKGRFSDCETSHRWLKGTDEKSEEELKILISYQKQRLNRHSKLSNADKLNNGVKAIGNQAFYKPLLTATLTICLYQVCETKDRTILEVEQYFDESDITVAEDEVTLKQVN